MLIIGCYATFIIAFAITIATTGSIVSIVINKLGRSAFFFPITARVAVFFDEALFLPRALDEEEEDDDILNC
jgi:hypothetical protein